MLRSFSCWHSCTATAFAVAVAVAALSRSATANRSEAQVEVDLQSDASTGSLTLSQTQSECEDASIGGMSAESSIKALKKCISALQKSSVAAHDHSKRSKEANSQYAQDVVAANAMLQKLLQKQESQNKHFRTFRDDQRKEMDELLERLGDMHKNVAVAAMEQKATSHRSASARSSHTASGSETSRKASVSHTSHSRSQSSHNKIRSSHHSRSVVLEPRGHFVHAHNHRRAHVGTGRRHGRLTASAAAEVQTRVRDDPESQTGGSEDETGGSKDETGGSKDDTEGSKDDTEGSKDEGTGDTSVKETPDQDADQQSDQKPDETVQTDEQKPDGETAKTDEQKPDETVQTDEQTPDGETAKTDEPKPDETVQTDEQPAVRDTVSQPDLTPCDTEKVKEDIKRIKAAEQEGGGGGSVTNAEDTLVSGQESDPTIVDDTSGETVTDLKSHKEEETVAVKIVQQAEEVRHAAHVLKDLHKDPSKEPEALQSDYEKKKNAAELAKTKLEEETKIYFKTKGAYDKLYNKTTQALEVYKGLAAEHNEYSKKYVAAWKSYHLLQTEALRAENAATLALKIKEQKVAAINAATNMLHKDQKELSVSEEEMLVKRKETEDKIAKAEGKVPKNETDAKDKSSPALSVGVPLALSLLSFSIFTV